MNEELIEQENKLYESTKDFGRIQFVREILKLQQENTQLKRMLNIKEKFDKKEVPYEWEFKDMFDMREENDTLKQQLKDKDEKISKIEKLTKQLKGSARYERCMDELDYILNIIKED